jgi:hypothetical protein
MRTIKVLFPFFAAAVALVLAQQISLAQERPSGIRWDFNETSGTTAHDSIGNMDDSIEGFFWRVPGAEGNGLQFDGYTTRIVRPAKSVPLFKGGFTVSAWVAPNYYPWNWVPIADQNADDQIGFFFGIDAFGHPGFNLAVNGIWRQLTSNLQLPTKRYSRVTATFDPQTGIAIYVNGKPAGSLNVPGRFSQAMGTDLIVGRIRNPQQPYPSWLDAFRDPVNYSLDGYLDGLEIVEGARSAEDEQAAFAKVNLPDKDVMPTAVFPSGPAGAGPFGAFYASLKFENSWDRPRRFGPDQDVVVRFEQSPMRLVFWQGTNFIPAWVTENNKWYTDEFLETWDRPRCPDGGDCEPMSDKQGRYSHVSILESSDARAVIHWRYALAEAINYKGGNADPVTGWFDWADEYWTVYPDGVAVRKQLLSSSHLDDAPHEWQESIVINNPGQMPEDNIEPDALTLKNMAGESETYHWQTKSEKTFDYPKGPPDKLDKPANANIQIVHLKSKENPFEIVWPRGNSMSTYSDTKSYSMFEWWDHWPVAQISNSFRLAVTPDRPSHASLSHIYWDPIERTEDTMTKLLLCGLTSPDAPGVVTLAKSWLSPAAITAAGAGVTAQQYDPAQRAYVIHRDASVTPHPLTVTLAATGDNPLVNPALVIENWSGPVSVHINGKLVAGKDQVRIGFNTNEGVSSLVVWLKFEANSKTVIQLDPRPE